VCEGGQELVLPPVGLPQLLRLVLRSPIQLRVVDGDRRLGSDAYCQLLVSRREDTDFLVAEKQRADNFAGARTTGTAR